MKLPKNGTIAEAISWLTAAFRDGSSSPSLDAEILLCEATGLSKTQLLMHPKNTLSDTATQQINTMAEKRINGTPIAYLIGKKAFWTLELTVNPDVLIPRPDTECLVEWALSLPISTIQRVADLGTGSGAIALSIACERPTWKIDATDQSMKAIMVAKTNACLNHIDTNNTLTFYHGDWFEALPKQAYDLILSNPPYIASNDAHLNALSHEPMSALVSGPDGLNDLRTIIQSAAHYLTPNGYLALEHGYDQADAVNAILTDAGFCNIQCHHDYGQQPRFTTAQWQPKHLL